MAPIRSRDLDGPRGPRRDLRDPVRVAVRVRGLAEHGQIDTCERRQVRRGEHRRELPRVQQVLFDRAHRDVGSDVLPVPVVAEGGGDVVDRGSVHAEHALVEVDLGRHHALHGGDQLAAEPPIDVLAELHGVQAHAVHVVRERALAVVGRHDQHVVVRVELIQRGDHPSELRVDLLEDEPLPIRLHVVDVTGVVRRLVVDVQQVRDAALPDGLAAERRFDQVALVLHDRRGAARGLPSLAGRRSGPIPET